MVRQPLSRTRREGIILVVVVSMLALFAVIGLGYVIYSESMATASRLSRDAQVVVDDRPAIQPELILNQILGALIYDKPDDPTGIFCALRGHSLARSMYGWNQDARGLGINPNQVPFNGLGRLKYTDLFSGLPSEQILNFMFRQGDPVFRHPEKYPVNPQQQNNYHLANGSADPTRYFGGYNVPYTYPDLNNVFLAAVRASDGVVLVPSFHRPWLFHVNGDPAQPTDHLFLLNPAHPDWYRPSGRLKLMRPRPIDNLTPQLVAQLGLPFPPPENLTAGQANQYAARLQQFIAQGQLMPFPSDPGGDVKNLLGSPGGNDSVWLDLGLPVYQTRSGRKFKPLVALLVRDLDGLVNINAHGNLVGSQFLPNGSVGAVNQLHLSNQGLGRHEINLEKVLGAEARNLFTGAAGLQIPGRFTYAATPQYPLSTPPNVLPSFLNPPGTPAVTTAFPPPPRAAGELAFAPVYYPVDVDGARFINGGFTRSLAPRADQYQPALPLTMSSFPDYYTALPPGTPSGYDNDVIGERLNHPLLFNPIRATGNSKLLDGLELHRLHARYDSPLDWRDSLLSRLLPNSMNNPAVRHMVTLYSADVGRPGLAPQTFRLNDQTPATYGIADPSQPAPWAVTGEQFQPLANYPVAGAPPQTLANDFIGSPLYLFPGPATAANSPAGTRQPVPNPSNPNQQLVLNDGRNQMAGVRERIDLNRPLRPYPPVVSQNNQGQFFNTGDPQFAQQYTAAEADRQAFCTEVFDALIKATGAPPLTPALAPGTPDFLTLKYLAQLAVNIVDDIDEDDVMTVFPWAPPAVPPNERFVFGVEMPKVVINEVYVEQTNGPQGDPNYVRQPTMMGEMPRALKYQVNMFVELNHTQVPPFLNDENPGSPSTQNYQAFVQRHTQWLANGPGLSYQAYRLFAAQQGTFTEFVGDPVNARAPDGQGPVQYVQFTGDPNAAFIQPVDTAIANDGPSSYRCRNGVRNAGFYVVAADQLASLQPPGWKAETPQPTLSSPAMRYDVPAQGNDDMNTSQFKPTFVLQRLANPYLPPQPNPGQAGYNPYVTVDVMDLTPPQVGAPTFQAIGQAIQYNSAGPAGMGGGQPKASVIRRQPLSGNVARLVNSQAGMGGGGGGGDPTHTFFSHNATSGQRPPTQLPEPGPNGLERFDWFVHHDRKLTSPVELIHVSAVPPWLLTQRFIYPAQTSGGASALVRQGHTAPWLDERETIDPMTGRGGSKIGLQEFSQTPPQPGVPPTLSSRLYRALEMFRVGDRTVEMGFAGRDIGKVNINTIWDKPVFDAVCDAFAKTAVIPGSNPPVLAFLPDASLGFTQFDVDSVWTMLTSQQNLLARTPNLAGGGPAVPYTQITGNDLPFWGMGAPHEAVSQQYPPTPTGVGAPAWQFTHNQGLEATLFRSIQPRTPGDPAMPRRTRLFDAESQFAFSQNPIIPGDNTTANPEPPVRHPLMEKSLLTKVFEHFTTRSNVFAVYMTVGYFEVTNDAVKPETLGDEIGIVRDATGAVVENKAIRHRMFAVVDRTNLALQPGVYDPRVNPPSLEGDPFKQGPAPFYYSSEVQPVLPPPSFPPLFAPFAGSWMVTLPASQFGPAVGGGGFVKWAGGSYNGIGWVLNTPPVTAVDPPGSLLYLDMGQEQRRLAVRAIRNLGNGFAQVIVGNPPRTGNQWPPLFDASNPVFPPTPRHPVRVTNSLAGNPGPQPDFDHKMPNYRGVVLYSVILD